MSFQPRGGISSGRSANRPRSASCRWSAPASVVSAFPAIDASPAGPPHGRRGSNQPVPPSVPAPERWPRGPVSAPVGRERRELLPGRRQILAHRRASGSERAEQPAGRPFRPGIGSHLREQLPGGRLVVEGAETLLELPHRLEELPLPLAAEDRLSKINDIAQLLHVLSELVKSLDVEAGKLP